MLSCFSIQIPPSCPISDQKKTIPVDVKFDKQVVDLISYSERKQVILCVWSVLDILTWNKGQLGKNLHLT